MIKSLLEAMIAQIVATLAMAVCISIGAVAAAFAGYDLLIAAMPRWAASAAISGAFLFIAVLILVWLNASHHHRLRLHAAKGRSATSWSSLLGGAAISLLSQVLDHTRRR